MAIELTKDNFDQEVMNSDMPVLVDFWAEWCGPCRMIAPVIEEVSKEYEGKIKIGKVNIDQNAEVASRFGVMSIPTMIIFNKGETVDQTVGALPKEKMISFIEPYIT
ncbi:MAG: thioredoxin [PVC group bacterium]|nr:thioredoxin [PVC group bacterium]